MVRSQRIRLLLRSLSEDEVQALRAAFACCCAASARKNQKQGGDVAEAAAPAPRPSAASENWKQCDDGAKGAAPAPTAGRKGSTFLAHLIWVIMAEEKYKMIRPEDVQAVLDATKKAVVAELKKSGHAAIPQIVSFKAVDKPAKDAHRKMSFGKWVQVDAKPAKKVVSAIVNRTFRKSLFGERLFE